MNGRGNFAVSQTACKTDAQGRMAFTDVPALDGYSYSLKVTAQGYGNGSGQLASHAGQPNRLDFPTIVLPLANQTLTGKVLDPDGKPQAHSGDTNLLVKLVLTNGAPANGPVPAPRPSPVP